MARAARGRFLLRIEDIDATRTREDYVEGIIADLKWLGLSWEEPVRRQSRFMADYLAAQERLQARGLLYPCFCSRTDIARAVEAREHESGAPWPRDPDGAPLYPGTCRALGSAGLARAAAGEDCAWRLDSPRALEAAGEIAWTEVDEQGEAHEVRAEPAAWGDVVLARKDIGTSYHIAVVIDDAAQGVTHVVRGRDLYHATSMHRLLQILLDLPAPLYTHHRLVLDANGEKLSKSLKSTALRELRAEGATPDDVRELAGLDLLDVDAERP